VWLIKTLKDIIVNTRISQKLAAVALAVFMNAAIMGGVTYLFSNTSERPASAQRTERQDGVAARVSARAAHLILGERGLAISI
jgi:hypothetical protein